jgi:hypothetical protein
MSDVNTFIETIGKDVSAALVPKIPGLVEAISASASDTVCKFVSAVIQDLSQRYQPEVAGELHTRIVQGGLEVTGKGVRLDVKNRQTGAVLSSLDIPVSLTIKVDPLAVTLQNATVALDVIK